MFTYLVTVWNCSEYCSRVVIISFLRVQSNANDQWAPLHTRSPAYLHPPVCLSMFQLLTGPMSRHHTAGGMMGERRAGTGRRCAVATDQTRAFAAGAGGSNSETLVTAQPACVGGGRERGRVKETDGQAGEWSGTCGRRLYWGTF